MIDRLLRLPEDTVNISYDEEADFLEGEKICLYSRKRDGKTWFVFVELM